MNKPAIKRLEYLAKRSFEKLAARLDEYHRFTVQEGGEKWGRADNARKYVNRLDGFYDDFVEETGEPFEYPKESETKADESVKNRKKAD